MAFFLYLFIYLFFFSTCRWSSNSAVGRHRRRPGRRLHGARGANVQETAAAPAAADGVGSTRAEMKETDDDDDDDDEGEVGERRRGGGEKEEENNKNSRAAVAALTGFCRATAEVGDLVAMRARASALAHTQHLRPPPLYNNWIGCSR